MHFAERLNFLFITFARMMSLKYPNNYIKKEILCPGRYKVKAWDTKMVKQPRMLLLSAQGSGQEHR